MQDGGVEVEGPPPDPSESSDISVGVVISRNWVIIAGVLTVVAIVLLAIGFSGGKRINQMGYDRNQRDRQLRQLDLAMPESCGSEGSGGTMLEDISLQTPTGDTDFHGSFGNGIGMPGAGAVASQSLGIRSSASGLLGAAIRRLQGFEHVPSGVSSPASATPRSSEPRVVRGEIRDDNNRLTNRSRSSDDES